MGTLQLLKWSQWNRKMHAVAAELGLAKAHVIAFDLPAGWTCPAAKDCKSKADRITGKITDGKDCKYRCYAASSESAFKNARMLRWHNFNLLKEANTEYQMTRLILASLPDNVRVVRIHTSGDFFNKKYYNAWIRVAHLNPQVTFYGYTKMAHYLESNDMPVPKNLRIVVSHGGKFDHCAIGHRRAYVMFGKNASIPVYNDVKSEMHIIKNQSGSFGILIHGTQPKGFHKNLEEGSTL